MSATKDFSQFNPRTTLQAGDKKYVLYSVKALEQLGYGPIERLPYCLRILLENLLRHYPQGLASDEDIDNLRNFGDGIPVVFPFPLTIALSRSCQQQGNSPHLRRSWLEFPTNPNPPQSA